MRVITLLMVTTLLMACQSTYQKKEYLQPLSQLKVLSPSITNKLNKIFKARIRDDYSGAMELINQLHANTDYDKAFIAGLKGSNYYSQGHYSKASEMLKIAVDSNLLRPKTHRIALKTLGESLLREQDFTHAEPYLSQLAKLNNEPMPDIQLLYKYLDNPEDMPVTKIRRVAPIYPVKAARDGIEGYVVMTYQVSPIGKISNIKVTESSPKGVFDEESIKALDRWRYPITDDSQELEKRKDMTVQLDFQLSKREK